VRVAWLTKGVIILETKTLNVIDILLYKWPVHKRTLDRYKGEEGENPLGFSMLHE